MSATPPILTADEAVDLLQRLLEKDLAIEDLKRQLIRAKSACDLVKEELKDAQEDLDKLIYEIRNPPVLFGGEQESARKRPRAEPPMSEADLNGEVLAGVREAEAARASGEWDLDVPLDPASLPKMPSALGLPKPAVPLKGKAKRGRKPKSPRAEAS